MERWAGSRQQRESYYLISSCKHRFQHGKLAVRRAAGARLPAESRSPSEQSRGHPGPESSGALPASCLHPQGLGPVSKATRLPASR